QFPIDAVEEALDVEVENPIVAPAALAGLGHGIDRRFAGTVAVGVGMKSWLQDRLQKATDDLLSDAIGDCRNAQRPRPAIRLRDVDPPHRRRKVAPLRTSDSRACRGCPRGWPRSPQSTVHLLQPLPGWPSHARRLPRPHASRSRTALPCPRAPPVTSWSVAKAEQRNPFAPAPLQGLQRYYGLLRPCRCASVLSPSRVTPLVASPIMPA